MLFLIHAIESYRIKNFNAKKRKSKIKFNFALSGDYITLWYLNREKEKGMLRFQFNKGICMSVKYKGYNSVFQLRSVIDGVAIEQEFFGFAATILLMASQKNPIPRAYRNCLKYLRGKKNFASKFKATQNRIY